MLFTVTREETDPFSMLVYITATNGRMFPFSPPLLFLSASTYRYHHSCVLTCWPLTLSAPAVTAHYNGCICMLTCVSEVCVCVLSVLSLPSFKQTAISIGGLVLGLVLGQGLEMVLVATVVVWIKMTWDLVLDFLVCPLLKYALCWQSFKCLMLLRIIVPPLDDKLIIVTSRQFQSCTTEKHFWKHLMKSLLNLTPGCQQRIHKLKYVHAQTCTHPLHSHNKSSQGDSTDNNN